MAMHRLVVTLAIGCACLGLGLAGAGADELGLVSSPERDVANDLLRQALASEVKGDSTEWTERLEEALAVLPGEQLTNSLLGLILVDGQWQAVEQLQRTHAADPRLTEYRRRRDLLDGKPVRELELARWCDENAWDDLARFHFARLVAYPDATKAAQKEAARKLDLQVFNGQYYTSAELAALQQQNQEKQAAFETWRPKIVAWRKACASTKPQQRDQAEQALQELREVSDPKAILAIEASLYDSSDPFAAELITLLGKFPEFEATQALVRFALLTPSPQLVQAAVKQLKPRAIHDYYPQLLVLLQAPVQSQFRVFRTRDGVIRYDHVVGQQGPDRNVVARNDRALVPADIANDGGRAPLRILPVADGQTQEQAALNEELARMSTFLTALSLQQKIAVANTQITLSNERVYYLLEQTSPQALPRDAQSWWTWWKEYQEKQSPAPTQYVYYYQQNKSFEEYSPVPRRHSCFVAGTKVWTELGRQKIETLQPGDRVLSRDVDTGELQFKLVIAKTLQAPSSLVKLGIGDEEIVATKSHPFWVSGKGWKMAKELAIGDVLHTLHGPQSVTTAAALPVPQETHNLVVQDFSTYFVGDTAALVHDVAYWKPTTTIVPGMRAAAK